MKTILRKVSDGRYFAGPDKWSRDHRKAFNFKSIDHALQFIQRWRLQDVELAFAFSDRQEVTGVPVEKMALKFSQD